MATEVPGGWPEQAEVQEAMLNILAEALRVKLHHHCAEPHVHHRGGSHPPTCWILDESDSIPAPCGGKVRRVHADLNQRALHTHGISANDVIGALSLQNLITPMGTRCVRLAEQCSGNDYQRPSSVDRRAQPAGKQPAHLCGGARW